MPLFSIVTVTLNPPEEDLRRTLDSVVGQDFQDWELIVKDGGSKVGVLDCVPEDERIRVVTEEDSGIFDAMNQGIQRATGDFVCLLNAGDCLFSDQALRIVAKAYGENSKIEFFYGNVEKPLSRSGFEVYPKNLSRRFLYLRTICHQAWFVRRQTYDRLGGYETDLPVGGDPRFLLRMLLVHKLKHMGLGVCLVTYQGGGISQVSANIEKSTVWVYELKLELFTFFERSFYGILGRSESFVKRFIYDPFLWRILRMLRSKH